MGMKCLRLKEKIYVKHSADKVFYLVAKYLLFIVSVYIVWKHNMFYHHYLWTSLNYKRYDELKN